MSTAIPPVVRFQTSSLSGLKKGGKDEGLTFLFVVLGGADVKHSPSGLEKDVVGSTPPPCDLVKWEGTSQSDAEAHRHRFFWLCLLTLPLKSTPKQ